MVGPCPDKQVLILVQSQLRVDHVRLWVHVGRKRRSGALAVIQKQNLLQSLFEPEDSQGYQGRALISRAYICFALFAGSHGAQPTEEAPSRRHAGSGV